METYQEFLARIDGFEKREIDFGDKYFKGNPSISQKVNKDNKFKNFYGDTVVFELNEATKDKLAEYCELLYKAAPECFCEKLVANTFHITLHDLSNSADLGKVAEELFDNELKVVGKLSEIQKFKDVKIKMKSKYIFNMVNTSLVMGLYPSSDDDYCNLMKLYSIFDDVKKLNYPFTPHITLAYFNINGFDVRTAKILEDIVNQLNNNKIEIELNVNSLYYQKFRSMNEYIDIINLGMTTKPFKIL